MMVVWSQNQSVAVTRERIRCSRAHSFVSVRLDLTCPATGLQTRMSWSKPALTMIRWEGLYSIVTTPRLWPFITRLHCLFVVVGWSA